MFRPKPHLEALHSLEGKMLKAVPTMNAAITTAVLVNQVSSGAAPTLMPHSCRKSLISLSTSSSKRSRIHLALVPLDPSLPPHCSGNLGDMQAAAAAAPVVGTGSTDGSVAGMIANLEAIKQFVQQMPGAMPLP